MRDGEKKTPVPVELAAPIGDGNYEVKNGECLNSIASRHGYFWKTLWDHPKNRALKDARKDHNTLLPGDKVFIPEKTMREESGTSDQLHTFRRKGVPSKLKLRLLKDGDAKPYAGKPFVLEAGGELKNGSVAEDGGVEVPIRPETQNARLVVGEGAEAETFDLELGMLDPPDSVRGAQQRLKNLGFLAGDPVGEWDWRSGSALSRFQGMHVVEKDGEEPSGVYDEKTMRKLQEVHGS